MFVCLFVGVVCCGYFKEKLRDRKDLNIDQKWRVRGEGGFWGMKKKKENTRHGTRNIANLIERRIGMYLGEEESDGSLILPWQLCVKLKYGGRWETPVVR